MYNYGKKFLLTRPADDSTSPFLLHEISKSVCNHAFLASLMTYFGYAFLHLPAVVRGVFIEKFPIISHLQIFKLKQLFSTI